MPTLHEFELGNVLWRTRGLTAYRATHRTRGEGLLAIHWQSGRRIVAREADPLWREAHVAERLGGEVPDAFLEYRREGTDSWGLAPWFAGVPLGPTEASATPELLDTLEIGAQCARYLDRIHALGGRHGSLTPQGILWCPETRTVRLADRGFASLPELPDIEARESDREYLARYQFPAGPPADHRSDLYSVGAVLYELLTGAPPFEAKDLLELQHEHRTRKPGAPHEMRDGIPTQVSRVVLRLLAKTPEERYRSASGVAADLDRCRAELESGGSITPFDLGVHEVPSRFSLSTRLYGREEEGRRLTGALQRLDASRPYLIAVAGPPGVGKTSLVGQLRTATDAIRGLFASGKFEQSATYQPYVGVGGLLSDLLGRLLGRRPDDLALWRRRIGDALGGDAAALRTLAPELELVYREPVPAVDFALGGEAGRRFYRACAGLIRLFSQAEPPLVCFLDDLQWMDEPSGDLLRRLLDDESLGRTLFVLAWRSDEVGTEGPLAEAVRFFEERADERIALDSLRVADIERLLLDSFVSSEPSEANLAAVLARKTGGNPFDLRQYIETLHGRHLLRFDPERVRWSWDIGAIERSQASEKSADLMLDRLRDYPHEVRELLTSMACLGGECTLAEIAATAGVNEETGPALLSRPLGDGLVICADDAPPRHDPGYRFAHDRIEQAALDLETPEERAARHRAIAVRLHACGASSGRGAFALAEQLEKCLDLAPPPFEPLELVQIYLQAGIEARDSTAYPVAKAYLERAAGFLGEGGWESAYELTGQLYRLRAEVDYQLGERGLSRALINVALRHARSPVEKARLYALLIVQDTLLGYDAEAIDRGRHALALLGFDLPDSGYAEALEAEIAYLDAKDVEARNVHSLPSLQSERTREILNLLMHLIPSTYFVEPVLNNFVAARMVRLSLDEGISEASPKGLSNYGVILAERGRFRDGLAYGELALALAKAKKFVKVEPRVLYSLAGSLKHWVRPLEESRELIDEGVRICNAQGERDYGAYLLTLARCQNEIHLGRDIAEFEREVETIRVHVAEAGDPLAQGMADAAYMALAHLDGSSVDERSLDVGELRRDAVLEAAHSHGHDLVACFLHLLEAHNHHFLGQTDDAERSIEAAWRHRRGVAAQMTLPMLHLFAALIRAESACRDELGSEKRAATAKALEEARERTLRWSESCPENFEHCHLLVTGAIARLRGNTLEAVRDFAAAAESAATQGFQQFEGLAHLHAAQASREAGLVRYARTDLLDARECFARWGARRVVSRVDGELFELSSPPTPSGPRDDADRPPPTGELALLMRVSEDFARTRGPIELAKAVEDAIVTLAGAQRACVLVRSDRGDGFPPAFEPAAAMDGVVPETMIDLAMNTREPAHFDPEDPHPALRHDPYLVDVRPLAASCIPLLIQDELVGLVYLENRISRMERTAFWSSALAVLATQAATCVRNIRLASDFERALMRRTEELDARIGVLEARVEDQAKEIALLRKLEPYVAPQVVDLVLSGQVEEALRTHRGEVAVVFCDLRGFTSFSEEVEPEESDAMLNDYHTEMGRLFKEFDAVVDHRAGDGIMAFLNDLAPCEAPAQHAVTLSIRLREVARELIGRWDRARTPLGFGVGLTFGYATMMEIGDEQHRNYGATGRTVSLASRLCDIARDGQILTTKRVCTEIDGRYRIRFVDTCEIKGMARPVEVYEVVE